MELLKSVVSGAWHGPRLLYRAVKRSLFGKSLQGKVVLLTGASSGIGRALAHKLFQSGCELILASRNTEALETVKNELMTSYNKAVLHQPVVVKLDMSVDDQSLLSGADEVMAIYGYVDVVINCAGISHRGTVHETDLRVYKDIMQVNFFGPLALIKGVLPSLIARDGHIVNISSLQGLLALPSRSAYSASKHAVQAFSDSLRSELNARGHRVAVTVVSPGYVKTNLSLNALTGTGTKHGSMDSTQMSGYEADYVAGEIVNSIVLEEEEIIIAQLSHSAAACLRHLFPFPILRLLEVREAVSIGTIWQYSKTWIPRWTTKSYWLGNKPQEDVKHK